MIIDLTHTIIDKMPVFPGDDPTALTRSRQLETDEYTNHQLNINMHCGTHIDGPMHLISSNKYLSDFPIQSFIGSACIINAEGEDEVGYEEKYEQIIHEGAIVVVYTGHSQLFGSPQYFTEYPALSLEFAQLLVRKKVKMVALDFPSPDYAPFEVHKLLFQNQILIAENLCHVEKILNWSNFDIIALPIAVKADSAIARIVARKQQ